MAIPNSFEILQAVIDATPDAIFVGSIGRYMLVKRGRARFCAPYRPTRWWAGTTMAHPEETARMFIEQDARVLASGTAISFEGVATADDGTRSGLPGHQGHLPRS